MTPQTQRNRRLLLRRTAVLVACYAVPLGGLALYLTLTGLNRQLSDLSRERLGVEYLRHAMRLHNVAAREILDEHGNDETLFQAELNRFHQWKTENLNSRSSQMPQVADANVDVSTEDLRESWDAACHLTENSPERHEALMNVLGEIHGLLSRTSDTSGLSLSPELETEYMSEIVAGSLPSHIDRLIQVHDSLAGEPADKVAGAAKLAARIINSEAKHLEEAIATTLRGDAMSSHAAAAFQRDYPEPARLYLASIKGMIAALNSGEAGKAGEPGWDAALRADYAHTEAFWATSVEGLTELIDDQIHYLRERRDIAYGIALVVLLTLIPLTYLYFRIYLRPLVQGLIDEVREAGDAALRAKNQFLAMMSHEIRTPMNGVIGFTTLLSDTRLDEQQREYVTTIRSSGEALLAVINDILDFSKLEAGRTEFESQPTAVREVIEDVLDLLSVGASAKQLELIYWIEPDVPEAILSDPIRLRQILLNLAGNAVKFTAEGHVEIAVSREAPPQGPVRLAFHIRDTGIGISPEGKERLFRPFSQVDASVTRTHGGTGLGLAICRRLVAGMGGTIGLESAPGKGTDFHFELPLVAAPEAAHGGMPADSVLAALKGRRILVVDDYPVNRQLLEKVLTGRGALVTGTTAGEALRQATETRFDLAVLDYMMPEIDGVSLARSLRETLGVRCPKLILATSAVMPASAQSLFSAVVSKPLRNVKFAETAARVLVGSASERAAPAESGPAKRAFALEHPLRILIADDNPVNLRVLSMTLTSFGYAPAVADNGESALEQLKANPVDLVFMDVQMPRLDGLEATRRLRRGESGPLNQRTHVVALTAGVTAEERRACQEAGMDDFLAKPIVRQLLLDKLVASSARPRS